MDTSFIGVLSTLFWICLSFTILFFIISVILFFVFDIRTIFNFRTGRARAKAVKEMSAANENTGRLRIDGKTQTSKLSDKDIGALKAELTDPRFSDEFWDTEIRAMLDMNKKAEQQALAKYGLDYVTDTYLPEKLSQMGIM